MTISKANPRLNDCIALYRRAYERHGTGSFTAEQLDTEFSEAETQRLLELTTAYGLIEFTGTMYRVTCAPDATTDCWQSAMRDHANHISNSIADSGGSPRDGATDTDDISHDDNTYVSVLVSETDDFETVADAIENADTRETEGIVLRSPGDNADVVQRIADRLCDASESKQISDAGPFQKELTDVVGHQKDDLEFRLFLLQDG